MTAELQRKPRKPFILRDVPSTMVQYNREISRGAQHLWLVMLSMADHRTGELRHKKHWYTGKQIDCKAGISDETRKKYMRELVAQGFAQMERARVDRVLTDRLTGHRRRRTVLGKTHYIVFKSPVKDTGSSNDTSVEKPHGLLRPNPSIVEKLGSQFLSKIHHGGENINHHPAPPDLKADDDSFFDLSKRIGDLQDRATRELVAEGHDPEFVELALERIDARSADAKTVPGSAAYYVHAFRTLLENDRERRELEDELVARRHRRKKYLGTTEFADLKLTAEQEERRNEFSATRVPRTQSEVLP